MKSKPVWNALDGSPETAWESEFEKGVFIYPAGSVDKKPPKFDSAKQTCAWDGKKWVVTNLSKEEELVSPPTPPTPTPPPAEEPEEPEEEEEYVQTYSDKRREEYGGYGEQIEFIVENGLEAYQKRVADIKKKYPKD